MSGEGETGPVAWTLAGGAADGTGALVRPVTAGEAEEILGAAEMLTRISGQVQYSAILDALQVLQEAEAQADPDEGEAALMGPCEAASATIEALRRFAETLTTEVAQDLHADPEAASELTGALDRVSGEPAWGAAIAMRAALQARDAELREADDGRAELVITGHEATTGGELDGAGAQAALPVRETLEAAVELAQLMGAKRLLACRRQIEDASRTLKGLAVEVLSGEPLLLEHPPGWPADAIAGSPIPHPLPMIAVARLERAIGLAVGLLQDTSETSTKTETGTSTDAPAGTHEAGAPGDGTDQPEESLSEDRTDGAGPPADPSPQFPPRRTVDLDALITHITTLSSELERAWSDALEEGALGEAFELLDGQWASLIATVATRAQDSVAHAQAAGISPLVSHPQDPSNAYTVSIHPTPDQAWRQLQLAEMTALERLLQALGALKSKHGAEIPRPGAEQEGWWQSGAFALVRLRARQLARAARALEAAETRLLAENDQDARPRSVQLDGSWIDRLELARAADSRGDPESTLIHLRLALRERAAGLAGCEADALNDSFEQRLADDPRLAHLSGPLSAMCEASRDLGAGRPVDLGACVALARFLIDPVSELCLGLGGELIDATRPRDDERRATPGAA
jgi:hypothetical protein